MKHKQYGFTIVELLIVIVVIAILAAIGIVAYNGIQRRANNAAIINAVSQTLKMIQAHTAQEGAYPSTAGGNICITSTSGCARDGGEVVVAHAAFDASMVRVGTLPRSVPTRGSNGNGIMYNYSATRVYDGQTQPAILFYYLDGTQQNCGVPQVMNGWGTPDPASRSTSGYTSSGASINKTLCMVSIPGPSA